MEKGMYIIVGLGATGLSCVRWLIHAGIKVAVADSRSNPPNIDHFKATYPHIPLYLGPLQANILQAYDVIVRSPGVSQYEPALVQATKAGVPVIGDIELFARHITTWHSQVIAITGSNGKSTVTMMVGEMAKEAGLNAIVAGNIGVPVLDILLALELEQAPHPDLFVLELSSFQLETTYSLQPVIATVLNISEDHLDRYTGITDYINTKARIFQNPCMKLLNRQDPYCVAMAENDDKVCWFGQDAPRGQDEYGVQQINGEYVLQRGLNSLMKAKQLTLTGWHNTANALAAIALCEAVGLSCEPCIHALKKFTGLAHRVQAVATINGVTYFDDSKATNVGATEAALKGMMQPVILIAGGQGKGQDFRPLNAACAAHCRLVILLGQDAALIAAALDNVVPVHYTHTMEEAVALAAEHATPNDVVLLSPACASLDMFADYKERSAVFIAAVKKQEGAR